MRFTLLALAALLAAPALAQDAPDAPEAPNLLRALELPVRAHEVRELGAPEREVRQVLEQAREGKMSAGDSAKMLEVEAAAAREHGNIDNFGAFVGERLDEGLRGQDLAAAIRAEHEARGKGKGEGQEHKHAHQGEGEGEHQHAHGEGKGEGGGAPESKGKSDDAGSGKGPGAGGHGVDGAKGSKGPGKSSKTRPAGK